MDPVQCHCGMRPRVIRTLGQLGNQFQGPGSSEVERRSLFFFFFFLNHQFITRRAKADRGSYFRNYVHRKQTQRKIKKEKKRKRKRKRKETRYKN